MFKRLWLGIRRHWIRALFALFASITGVWSLVEPLLALLNLQVTKYNGWCVLVYILVSLIVSSIVVWPKRSTAFRFANTGTRVRIVFGDIFSFKGNIVIPANEYFDSELGKPVSPNSVHGAFISNVLGGHIQIMDQAINDQLHGLHIQINTRSQGKQYQYPIGTTFYVNHDQRRFFLFAMSTSDSNCKASSNPSMMLEALDGLWNKIRIEGSGGPVFIPLVGNGLSGVGLPPTHLLQLILISILKSVKEKGMNSTIHIVLRDDVFEDIDLELIKNNWT